MQYRNFGSLDFKVSALGFGAMRLPTRTIESAGDKPQNRIDEAEAIKMIRHAIDMGVNYVDTAYIYHDGFSEIVTGKALKDGYREKVKLATKSPTWLINEAGDFDRILDEQLEKLQTDSIDFYLLHSLSRDSWNNVILKYDLLKRAEAAKEAGKIKHLGFSFHDEGSAFTEIVDGYDKWEFCQIQYNYLDIENQAGLKGLKYAASKGIAVVIMEPLLGGKLANPPKDVKAILDENGKNLTGAEWALQWLWNQPEVSVVLSGMSTMPQVEENLASAEKSGVGTLNEEDLKLIDRAITQYGIRTAIPCTGCQYCMPCPNNVNIPRNFELYNSSVIHEDLNGARFAYSRFFNKENHASECIQCKVCEENCPQKIPISEWLPKVHEMLG
ncbi:general stress protein 69 [Ruminiclostridium hungatei]|uniref:General stress protein 69 n=1 Tax=Ruminiclostridium hungatei TaxID=48256 RepID=A0A1V4SFE1_RUMHU|nr:aldo/keto reductase [Ruminiclostridium hungatei]OPX42588.1 general stress protein 69 [Ruminiclostridium hungatei]